jgi:hypothetical protein
MPETFIQDHFVQLAKGSTTEIAGWVRINSAATWQQVTIEIPEAGVQRVVTTDAAGFADFRSPRWLLPGIQDYHNRKGLISDRGQRDQAFYVLQRFYREQAP